MLAGYLIFTGMVGTLLKVSEDTESENFRVFALRTGIVWAGTTVIVTAYLMLSLIGIV